jgi:hypothetical protein
VTLSSAKAEYVAATRTTCQAVWMRRMLKYLLQEQQEPTTIFFDNNSSIMLSKNHVFHKKTKHNDTRYHFIIELVNNKEICLEFSKSKEQVVDIFTKPLARDAFQHLRSSLGVCAVTNE